MASTWRAYWLDAARYGDTHGLHLDNYREIWPYRDWVIRAFNRNLPFDQFITEQLAGDLLPDPSDDQLIATGFNRCHVTTNEGGSIEEEVYVRNVVDRVVTFGTVFLGMTLDCTRCHDHKFDPVTMNDFYSLSAYFNSLDGKALDGNRKDHAPVKRVGSQDELARLARLERDVKELETTLKADWSVIDEQQVQWEEQLRSGRKEPSGTTPIPEDILSIARQVASERSAEQSAKLREFYRFKVSRHPASQVVQDQLTKSRALHKRPTPRYRSRSSGGKSRNPDQPTS